MKAQVVLPEALLLELKQVVPFRKRSEFIAQAVETKLQALKFQRAIKLARGCWSDKHHPTLKTQADINQFLARFRGRFGRRGSVSA